MDTGKENRAEGQVNADTQSKLPPGPSSAPRTYSCCGNPLIEHGCIGKHKQNCKRVKVENADTQGAREFFNQLYAEKSCLLPFLPTDRVFEFAEAYAAPLREKIAELKMALRHGEEMYIAMRNRCARIEAELDKTP